MKQPLKKIKHANREITAADKDAAKVFRALVAPWTSQGLVILPLEEAVARLPALVDELWPEAAKISGGDAWQSAEHEGYLIRVPPGLKIMMPLQPPPGTDRTRFGCQLVVVEDGAELELLQGCYSPVLPGYADKMDLATVVLRAGAKLKLFTAQNSQEAVADFSARSFHLAAGAELFWRDVDVGTEVKTRRHAITADRGAVVDFQGLYTTREARDLRGSRFVATANGRREWPFKEGQEPVLSLGSFMDEIPFEYRVELRQILDRGGA